MFTGRIVVVVVAVVVVAVAEGLLESGAVQGGKR